MADTKIFNTSLYDTVVGLPLFTGMSEGAALLLVSGVTTVFVKAGTAIFTQGDPGDKFYVLLSGNVDIIIDKTVVASLNDQHWFGELALLDSTPRAGTAKAVTDCALLVIPRNVLLAAVSEDPTIALRLVRGYASKLRQPPKAKGSAVIKVITAVLSLIVVKVLSKHMPGDTAKAIAAALSDEFSTIASGAVLVVGYWAKRQDDKSLIKRFVGRG